MQESGEEEFLFGSFAAGEVQTILAQKQQPTEEQVEEVKQKVGAAMCGWGRRCECCIA